ncbi:MAG TPA: tetratricopeptide repeat protein [Pyrinomonadaceae bacterium]|jgi:Flp pilus assembly protein TadD|nr:tetratricopeptide repeat protein [Pyrinomonadaceae bacterium]
MSNTAAPKCIFALALVLVCSCLASGQNAINELQGRVITPSGTQPTNPVRVKLTFNGRHIHETFTDLSGHFSFPGLSRGTYQLTAEGDGLTFETTVVYAEISAFGSAGQSFTQDIQLRPIAHKPTAQPGVVNAFTQQVPPTARQAHDTGLKLAAEGKTVDAVENMRKAIQIFPEYFDAHLQLGNMFLKQDQFNEAITELDLARQINPNDERAYQSFGLLLLKQRNYPVAVAIFAEAARLNPSNPMNAVMRATALIHQAANTDESAPSTEDRTYLLSRAEIAMADAARLSENKLKPDTMTIALFYELKGDPERAAAGLESYLRKNPQLKNSAAVQAEIKRLRDKAKAP